MMKLSINPAGGMAGDMFAAALISAGADFKRMQKAMNAAGEKLGSSHIGFKQTPDGAVQLTIDLESKNRHLGESQARQILDNLFHEFSIREKYRKFGRNILEILIKAEKQAHAQFNIVVEGAPSPNVVDLRKDEIDKSFLGVQGAIFQKSPLVAEGINHSHPHTHDHEESFLHEAQDIVIDIMGAVTGMQELDIEPRAELLCPVSVGGGRVHFSHGTYDVPAPATAVILKEYRIEWKKGPIEVELFTPTGAAILAALGSLVNRAPNPGTPAAAGKARGSKILDIPAFEIFLYEEE
jgi:hypothetical protein